MAFDLVEYLENQKKQPVDCNGTLLSVGDVVHDRWGYDLIVNIDEADIEDNKAVTVDVSTYTEPIEITPTAGKDGMAKVVVTLTGL